MLGAVGVGQGDLGGAQLPAAARQGRQFVVAQQQRSQQACGSHLVGVALLDILRSHVEQGGKRGVAEQEAAMGVADEDEVVVGVHHPAQEQLLVVQAVTAALQLADVPCDRQVVAQPGGHQANLESAPGLHLAPGVLPQTAVFVLLEQVVQQGFNGRGLGRPASRSCGQAGYLLSVVHRIEVIRNGLQQRSEPSLACLRRAGQLLADAQITVYRPEGDEKQRDHHQAADEGQTLGALGRLGNGAAGCFQLAPLLLFHCVEQRPQAIHQQVAAGAAQALGGRLQAGVAARLDIAGSHLQSFGSCIQRAEPALVGIAAAFDQLFQAAPIAFQLVQAALVGFEVAGIAGQDETARAGFDVLQGGEDGLDRGDDLQAMADGPVVCSSVS